MRWRTTITMIVLILLVAGAGWYGYRELVSPPEKQPDAQDCADDDAADGMLRAGEVTVNVYNAGDVSGLAGATLASLQRRGFVPGASENAPARLAVRTAVIYGSRPKSAATRLVQMQFVDKVRVVARPNIGEGVDVVLGSRFHGIDRSARTSLAVSAGKNACGRART